MFSPWLICYKAADGLKQCIVVGLPEGSPETFPIFQASLPGDAMSTSKIVAASFSVNIEHLHALGVSDPYSEQSLQLYHSGKLNANERLYFSLWGSSELSTSLIRAKTRFARQGEPVNSAYFVIKGSVLGVKGEDIYRLGPGSVIGLAEGVGGLPYNMDAVAVDDVQVRVFPIYVISKLVKNMPPGLKGILKSTVMRTLQLTSPPPLLS